MTRAPLTILAALLLAGCGAPAAPPGGVEGVRAARCSAGTERSLGSRRVSYAAIVRAHAVAARRPGGPRLASFRRLNVNGVPVVFWALGKVVDRSCRATWYHVQLPVRPNGVTGYVRASDVELARVRTRIVVDLSARRVTLFRDGREVLHATAAVGSAATPTPTGRFYVNQRLVPADTTGPFGPGAVGISAFSNVLTGWTQGGPIAIHGTNQPWSIGRAVSNGCVRLPNDVLRRLFRATLAGTPVLIRR
jgi:lipoprotein-anchoring transpeptidase ErfK/SrfK